MTPSGVAPPGWANVPLLEDAVRHAAGAVSVSTPATPDIPAGSLAWGAQVDVRTVTSSGTLTQQAVAGYIAKYATRAAECVGTLDRRLDPAEDWPRCRSLRTPGGSSANAFAWVPWRRSRISGSSTGLTCSASGATSQPSPTATPLGERLLTVGEAAEVLSTSERFPRRLIAERRIRFVRLGEEGERGHVRIPESALRESVAGGLVEPMTASDVWKAA